jgi:hypothetical protein
MKPDGAVIRAQLAQKEAEAGVDSIDTLAKFLNDDPTNRRLVYRLQVLQELTKTANTNGHKTIFMTDLGTGGAPPVLPLPQQ